MVAKRTRLHCHGRGDELEFLFAIELGLDLDRLFGFATGQRDYLYSSLWFGRWIGLGHFSRRFSWGG